MSARLLAAAVMLCALAHGGASRDLQQLDADAASQAAQSRIGALDRAAGTAFTSISDALAGRSPATSSPADAGNTSADSLPTSQPLAAAQTPDVPTVQTPDATAASPAAAAFPRPPNLLGKTLAAINQNAPVFKMPNGFGLKPFVSSQLADNNYTASPALVPQPQQRTASATIGTALPVDQPAAAPSAPSMALRTGLAPSQAMEAASPAALTVVRGDLSQAVNGAILGIHNASAPAPATEPRAIIRAPVPEQQIRAAGAPTLGGGVPAGPANAPATPAAPVRPSGPQATATLPGPLRLATETQAQATGTKSANSAEQAARAAAASKLPGPLRLATQAYAARNTDPNVAGQTLSLIVGTRIGTPFFGTGFNFCVDRWFGSFPKVGIVIPDVTEWLLPNFKQVAASIRTSLMLPTDGTGDLPHGVSLTPTSDGILIYLPTLQPSEVPDVGFRYGIQVGQAFGIDFGIGVIRDICFVTFAIT